MESLSKRPTRARRNAVLNRRDFMRWLGIGGVAATVAPSLFGKETKPVAAPMPAAPVGEKPFRINNWKSADLRSLLMMEQVGAGEWPTYELDTRATAWMHVGSPRPLPIRYDDKKEDANPYFTMKMFDQGSRSEENAKIMSLLLACDSNKVYSMNEVAKKQSEVVKGNTEKYGDLPSRFVSGLNQAFASIEAHDLCVSAMVVHPRMLPLIEKLCPRIADGTDCQYELNKGLVAHVWTADVLVCEEAPWDRVVLVAPPEYVGAYCERQSRTGVQSGAVVINDYAVATMKV